MKNKNFLNLIELLTIDYCFLIEFLMIDYCFLIEINVKRNQNRLINVATSFLLSLIIVTKRFFNIAIDIEKLTICFLLFD